MAKYRDAFKKQAVRSPDTRSLSERNQIDFRKIAFNALDLLPMIRYIKNKFFVFYFYHSVDCYGCLYP